MSEKPSNPKDVIGSGKLPLELVPDTAVAYMALSFFEGASKYGRFNWRVAGVRASIYRAAMGRHIMKWWNGEDCDPKTNVHHLASVMACCAIILDAKLVGKLTDDRAPRADVGGLIEALEGTVVHLKELFKDHNPKQYTIADSPPGHAPLEPDVEAFMRAAGHRSPAESAVKTFQQVYEDVMFGGGIGVVRIDPKDLLRGTDDANPTATEIAMSPELQPTRGAGPGPIVPAVREPQKVLSPSLKCARCGVSNGWRHSPDCPEAYG